MVNQAELTDIVGTNGQDRVFENALIMFYALNLYKNSAAEAHVSKREIVNGKYFKNRAFI